MAAKAFETMEVDVTKEGIINSLPFELKNKFAKDDLYKHLDLFFQFDDDDSGTIGAGELKMMLRDLGFSQISRSQCKKLIKDIDIDGSGDISFEEFNVLLLSVLDAANDPGIDTTMQKKNALTAKDLIATIPEDKSTDYDDLILRANLFLQYDDDGSGSIGVGELKLMFKSLGIEMTRSECKELASELDTDGSGDISFQEFNELLSKLDDHNNDSGIKETKAINTETVPSPTKGDGREIEEDVEESTFVRNNLEPGISSSSASGNFNTFAKAIASLTATVRQTFSNSRLNFVYKEFVSYDNGRVEATRFHRTLNNLGVHNVSIKRIRSEMESIDPRCSGLRCKLDFSGFCTLVNKLETEQKDTLSEVKASGHLSSLDESRHIYLPVPWETDQDSNKNQSLLLSKVRNKKDLRHILLPILTDEEVSKRVTTIQKHARVKLARKELKRKLEAKFALKKQLCAVSIQSHIRGYLARVETRKLQVATIKLQAYFRGNLYRTRKAAAIATVSSIVSNIFIGFFSGRGFTILDTLREIRIKERRNKCAKCIQRFVCNWLYRQKILRWVFNEKIMRESAASVIQKRARSYLAVLKHWRALHHAATTIQLFVYGIRHAKAYAKTLRIKRKKQTKAAINIQRIFRGFVCRTTVLETLKRAKVIMVKAKAAILIQKHLRGWLHRISPLGSIFWKTWNIFKHNLAESQRINRDASNVRNNRCKQQMTLKRLQQQNLGKYTQIKDLKGAIKSTKRPRSFLRGRNRFDIVHESSSPVFAGKHVDGKMGVGYNAHAEAKQCTVLFEKVNAAKTKLRSLNMRVKVLKKKVEDDHRKLENDRSKACRAEFNNLAKREVSLLRRLTVLKAAASMSDSVEVERKYAQEQSRNTAASPQICYLQNQFKPSVEEYIEDEEGIFFPKGTIKVWREVQKLKALGDQKEEIML